MRLGKSKTNMVFAPPNRTPLVQNVRGSVQSRPGRSRAGVIGTERANATSLGTGLTKTLLGGAAITLPDWTKCIKGVYITLGQAIPTASESTSAICILESNDFKIGPCELIANPIGAGLGAAISPSGVKPVYYEINAPCNGGSLSIYGQSLVANTNAPVMAVTVVISDVAPGKSQIFSRVGVIASSGTVAATEIVADSYAFTSCGEIVELCGMYAPDVIVAADDVTGYVKFESREFSLVTPAKLELNQVAGALGAGFTSQIDGVSRERRISIPTTDGQVSITPSLYMDSAPAAAGNWVSGVRFRV